MSKQVILKAFLFLFILGSYTCIAQTSTPLWRKECSFLYRQCHLKYKDSFGCSILIKRDQMDYIYRKLYPGISNKRLDTLIYNSLNSDTFKIDNFLHGKSLGQHFHKLCSFKDSTLMQYNDNSLIAVCFNSNGLIKDEYNNDSFKWYLVSRLIDSGYAFFNDDESGNLYYVKIQ